MIEIKKLTPTDIGRRVEYSGPVKRERGRLKSWNDRYLFVVYDCDSRWDAYQNFTAQATNPKDVVLFT